MFVEVEAIAQGEDDLAPAQAAVLDLAVELDLGEVEPRSYLRMTPGTRVTLSGAQGGSSSGGSRLVGRESIC